MWSALSHPLSNVEGSADGGRPAANVAVAVQLPLHMLPLCVAGRKSTSTSTPFGWRPFLLNRETCEPNFSGRRVASAAIAMGDSFLPLGLTVGVAESDFRYLRFGLSGRMMSRNGGVGCHHVETFLGNGQCSR